MRSRYAARTSFHDLAPKSAELLGCVPFSRVINPRTGDPVKTESRDTSDKSSVVLAARQLSDGKLLDKYHTRAKAQSESFGCANCRGVELVRSILLADDHLRGGGGESVAGMAAVRARYDAIVQIADFGGGTDEQYATGVVDGDGKPVNPFKQAWYELIRGRKAQIGAGAQFNGVTKQSANAHAVLSRKTLAIGFRYGPGEFLVAPSASGHRDIDTVITQAMKLAGQDNPDITAVRALWNALVAAHGKAYRGEADLDGFAQVDLARALADSLVAASSGIVAADADWAVRRARLAGLCAAYRAFILTVSAKARKLAPKLDEPLAPLRSVLTVASSQDNAATAGFDAYDVDSFFQQRVTADKGYATALNDLGLQWLKEGGVEFGHQCGICEVKQGDGDLTRRLLDFAAGREDGDVVPNPKVGAGFADLGTDPAGDTVWDMSNAVVDEAVAIYYTRFCDAYRRRSDTDDGTPGKIQDFYAAMAHHLAQTSPLFVAYMETLFQELAYCAKTGANRRLIRVLAP